MPGTLVALPPGDFGKMNPTAIKEATKIGFPMDRLVGNWWAGNDDDARPAGADAKGYTSLDLNAVGINFPAIEDIIKYVVDKGKSQVVRRTKSARISIIAAYSTPPSSPRRSVPRRV
jgi:hypothetical protein